MRFEKKNPRGWRLRAYPCIPRWSAHSLGPHSGTTCLANTEIPQMINYAAVTAIIQHVDSSTKNFYISQDPTPGGGRSSHGTSTTHGATAVAA